MSNFVNGVFGKPSQITVNVSEDFFNRIKYNHEMEVQLIDKMGDDHALGAAARVQTPEAYDHYIQECAAEGKPFSLPGLINYLMKHRHGTPFEHAAVKFLCRCPIFVWREWHRHRIGFSYNEESGRYKQLEPEFYIPPIERPMFKVDGWKPGRPKFLTIVEHLGGKGVGEDAYDSLIHNLKCSYMVSYEAYEENLALGIDPGLARDCLPVGIYSSCYVTLNPRSMMAFLSLRTHEPTAAFVSYPLYEIEEAARMCEAIFADNWPITYKAFCENGRVAP